MSKLNIFGCLEVVQAFFYFGCYLEVVIEVSSLAYFVMYPCQTLG